MNPIPYHTLIHQITCIEYACLYLFLLFLKKFMFLNSKVFSQRASQLENQLAFQLVASPTIFPSFPASKLPKFSLCLPNILIRNAMVQPSKNKQKT